VAFLEWVDAAPAAEEKPVEEKTAKAPKEAPAPKETPAAKAEAPKKEDEASTAIPVKPKRRFFSRKSDDKTK
jgi:hypothetical protein